MVLTPLSVVLRAFCSVSVYTRPTAFYILAYLFTAMLYADILMSCVFLGNVFCFNDFNRFTWFNMGRMTKNDRCLVKTIKTENI